VIEVEKTKRADTVVDCHNNHLHNLQTHTRACLSLGGQHATVV
jgi:undecaprenyl pyrophosphate synthase